MFKYVIRLKVYIVCFKLLYKYNIDWNNFSSNQNPFKGKLYTLKYLGISANMPR